MKNYGLTEVIIRRQKGKSSSCRDISPNTNNVNLLAVLEAKLEDHLNHQDSSSGEHENTHKISKQSIKNSFEIFELD